MKLLHTFLSKLKNFFKKNKTLLWHAAILVMIVVAISVLAMVLLTIFDVIQFDDGMHFNSALFTAFSDAWYGWLVFIGFQTGMSILLCAIPGAAMAFTLLIMTIYTEPWEAFVVSFISMLIASTTLYIVGRYGGYRICVKYLGEKDSVRAMDLMRNHGTVYFPLLMMFPTFPDEALTMIAGTLKMSLKWFVPSIVFGRGIGIAAITFGLSAVPFDRFTSIFHWIAFIAICAVFIVAVFYGAHRINVAMAKKAQRKAEQEKDI